MKKLAVDIVLLPPKEIHDLALEVNKNLNPKEGEIVFENGDMLPHVSLLMGVLEIGRLKEVEKLIRNGAKMFKPLALEIKEIEVDTLSDGTSVSGFGVSRTPRLRELQQWLARQSETLLGNDVGAKMFYGQAIREGIIEYLRNFRTEHSFEKFRPHITLGVGKAENKSKFPIPFTASKIALCHLGNYGTCRKILFSTELGNS